MTKLYQKYNGSYRYLSTVAGVGASLYFDGTNSNGSTYVNARTNLYSVEGATETLLLSNGGATSFDPNVAIEPVVQTASSTISSATITGGTVLKQIVECGIGSQNETYTSSITMYSGPLVSTGISSTSVTFSYLGQNDGSDTGTYGLYSGGTDTYIDGLTLTGTPTTVKLYLANSSALYGNSAVAGTWGTNSYGDVPNKILGPKLNSVTNYNATAIPTNTYLRLKASSLPFVKQTSVTGVRAVVGCSSGSSGTKLRLHCFAANSPTGTAKTLVNNQQTTADVPSNGTIAGIDFSPTTTTQTINADDIFVAEIGHYQFGAATVYHYYGGVSTDLSSGMNATTRTGFFELTLGSAATTYDETVSADAIVIYNNEEYSNIFGQKQFDVDAQLDSSNTYTETFDIDSRVKTTSSKSYELDGILSGSVLHPVQIDLLLKRSIIEQGSNVVVDSISETQYTAGNGLYNDTSGYLLYGETFVPKISGTVSHCSFYSIRIGSSPSGYYTAYIATVTGTNGVDAVPDAVIATSSQKLLSDITGSLTWNTWYFDNTVKLNAGIPYAVYVTPSASGPTATNYLSICRDDTPSTPTHTGNHVRQLYAGAIAGVNTRTAVFSVSVRPEGIQIDGKLALRNTDIINADAKLASRLNETVQLDAKLASRLNKTFTANTTIANRFSETFDADLNLFEKTYTIESVTASTSGNSTVSVVWSASANSESGFEIYRKIDNGAYVLVHTAAADTTFWVDTPPAFNRIKYMVRSIR
jgi:hypothetical protein